MLNLMKFLFIDITFKWVITSQFLFMNSKCVDGNFFWQTIHLNDLSPVWLHLCTFNWVGWLNVFSQSLHLTVKLKLSMCKKPKKKEQKFIDFANLSTHLNHRLFLKPSFSALLTCNVSNLLMRRDMLKTNQFKCLYIT